MRSCFFQSSHGHSTLRRHLLADVQHHVIAESREFVVGSSTLELYLHMGDLRPTLANGIKELGIDQQFAFLPDPFLYTLPEFLAAQSVVAL